jgi:excisionase family DNA binding protein
MTSPLPATRARITPTAPVEPRLYTISEVAALWAVSRDFVERLMARGELRFVRIGERARRIPPEALTEYITDHGER